MRTLLLSLLLATSLHAQPDARIEKLLRATPLIDGHNDLPWHFRARAENQVDRLDLASDLTKLERPTHTDIARLRRGMVGAQFWSVWVPVSLKGADAVQTTMEQIDVVHRMTARWPETFAPASTAADIERIHRSGRIASLIGVEGGHSINNSLAVLRLFHAAGARYMTLTHSENVDWADSGTADPKLDGLSAFGVTVVGEMNRLGMMVDLSHVSAATMNDALDVTEAPVIFSHSSARALTDHARNVPDDVLRRLKSNGGLVMVTFVPDFVSEKSRVWRAEESAMEARLKELWPGDAARREVELKAWRAANPRPSASVADVADHIDHVVKIAGEDHAGIGGDLDGIGSTPVGLASVADYPNLFAELIRRGYTDAQLTKLAGTNLLRVMRAVEGVAARLQKERAPADTPFSSAAAAK